MATLKQIEANRLNALKSTGPRSESGKQRSRGNALRHGLTAETVITALEDAVDYRAFELNIAADFKPQSAAEHELVARLASVLWRLRRSTRIETGMFELQAEFMRRRMPRRRTIPQPMWDDNGNTRPSPSTGRDVASINPEPLSSSEALATCYLQVSRLGYGAFDLLSRYEAALWRQAAQIMFLLQPSRR